MAAPNCNIILTASCIVGQEQYNTIQYNTIQQLPFHVKESGTMLRYTCIAYLVLSLSVEGLLSLWLSLAVSTDMTFMETIAMGQYFSPHPATANRVTIVILCAVRRGYDLPSCQMLCSS